MEASTPVPAPTGTARGPLAGLRIRWDRTIIFLAGAMLLLTALITGLMAPFTAVSWAVPAMMTLLGLGCIGGLRYLAVEERREPTVARHRAPVITQPSEQKLFDNEDEARQKQQHRERRATAALDLPEGEDRPQEETAPREPVYTVDELRAEALKVARSSAPSFRKDTWQPVPVPKPMYTQAAVVQPREPEPLPVPQRPAARSSTLRDAVEAGSTDSAALNLDDVLKRRRA